MTKVKLAPGDYVLMADLWRFGGQVDQERIAYAGLDLSRRDLILDDDAELLLAATAEHGRHWLGVDSGVDMEEITLACEEVLIPKLENAFWEEKTARQAEQEDRAAIQLRTLERRLREQTNRLQEQIEKQRREQRVRGSIIAANVGRLRALEERAALRKDEIEKFRKVSAQKEPLVAAIVRLEP